MSGVACCSGTVDAGTPQGSEKKLKLTSASSIDCYWAPAQAGGNCAVIIVTDIFGWKLPNARLLADKLGPELNATVIVPDLFNGGAPAPEVVNHMWRLVEGGKDVTFGQKMYSGGSLMYNLVPFLFTQSRAKSVELIKQVRSRRFLS